MWDSPLRAAEFFAGMGLVRAALEQSGFGVVFANDISAIKFAIYAANFGDDDFHLGDIRDLWGDDIPTVELATASFPCTDLSVAGGRAGLAGTESGLFWQFTRVLEEMGERKPQGVLLENVMGFATSHGGRDLEAAVEELNRLGYSCDLIVGDAKWFVPQSRPRLFLIGLADPPKIEDRGRPTPFRPRWVLKYREEHPQSRMHFFPLPSPAKAVPELRTVVEQLPDTDRRWWPEERMRDFEGSLSPIQSRRVNKLIKDDRIQLRTAYRRTRRGGTVWEVRRDKIAGCLRTASGGSSKQALVEAGRGELRVRWLTPREYARLQGADDVVLDTVTVNQALNGLGDAVCVPVVSWVARHYLMPALRSSTGAASSVRQAI
ncbi:MAG: DNA (cytosine-5-)-methyltransferase [bacterium]|nr:DNA (cytosine-5-)-methyltransferase [bacterium]MDE0602280.1 DNA (cytosine-5-)-methyltransferase [bacterium]